MVPRAQIRLGRWWEEGASPLSGWQPCQLRSGAATAPASWGPVRSETGPVCGQRSVNQSLSPSLVAVTPDPRPPPAVAGSLGSPAPDPEATLQALRGRVVGSGQRLAKGMGARHQESSLQQGSLALRR